MLLCSHCQDGYGLEKEQWSQASLVSTGLKQRGYELTMQELAESAVELARKVFPDIADEVRGFFGSSSERRRPSKRGRGATRGARDRGIVSGDEELS